MTSDSASAGRSRSKSPTETCATTACSFGSPSGRQSGARRRRPEHAHAQPSQRERAARRARRLTRAPAARDARRERRLDAARPAAPPFTHEPRAVAGRRTGSAMPSWSACACVRTRASSRSTPASSSRASIGPPGGRCRPARGAVELQQRRVTLSDVEEGHHELAGRGGRGRDEPTPADDAAMAAATGGGRAAPTASAGRAPLLAREPPARRAPRPREPRRRGRRAGGVGRGQADRPPRRTVNGTAACGKRGGRGGDPVDVGQQRRVEQVERLRELRQRPGRSPCATMPSHISGGTAGAATRLAGSDTTDTSSKWNASSGPVASARRGGDGEASGRQGRGARAASAVSQRGREREQPDHRGEGELPTGLAGGRRIERERDGGREAERVPARATAVPQARPRARRRPSRRPAGSTARPPASGT